MQLLTEELKTSLPIIHSQEYEKDPMIMCKFFDPVGSWTWYAIEGEKTDRDDFLFFGYVVGFEAELGFFLLSELTTAKKGTSGFQALPIERDLYFTPCRLSEVKKMHSV